METKKAPVLRYQLRYVAAAFLLYILVSIPLYLHTMEFLYINMVWNVFLAFLPLLFANMLIHGYSKWGYIRKWSIGILWLIFFPNAPYMITDFIHISGYNFYLNREQYSQLILSTNMTIWIRIVYIGLGMFMGILAGLLSLRMIHKVLRQCFNGLFTRFFLLAIFVLTGYGIFLGRFLRLNSWNIVHPHRIVLKMISTTSVFTIKITILYAFFICAIYIVFYLLCPVNIVVETDQNVIIPSDKV